MIRPDEMWDALERRSPLLLSVLLGAMIAAELVRLTLTLQNADHDGGAVQEIVRASPSEPRVDTQRIVAAHLFGVAEVSPGTRISEPTAAPANLVLDGTLATAQPNGGLAIIRDGGGGSSVYAVGQGIGPALLRSVYVDHVIIEQAGVLELLEMPKPKLDTASTKLRRDSPAHVTAPGLHVDNLGRNVDKAPGALDKLLRTVGLYDSKGEKLRGYYIYPVKDAAPLRAMGLDPGDLLTAVNGTPLDDLKRSEELLSSIGPSSQVSVTFQRQGRTQTGTLNIAEAFRAMTP